MSVFDPDGVERAVAEARVALRHGACKAVLAHWAKLAADGPPTRAALDPLAMPGALPLIWMMDYDRGHGRFVYRLIGETIRDGYDRPLIGVGLDQIVPPRDYARVERYFRDCVEKPAIVVITGRLYEERERPGEGDRVLLPLFGPAGQANGILGCTLVEHLFPTRNQAFENAKRRILTLPLSADRPPHLLEY